MPVIDRLPSDSQLPASAAVAVIGAGIAGIATALELADRGIDVVVFEKGEVAAEQSSRNWGWCRQMGRDPREIPLVLRSLELWQAMDARLGIATGFTRCGILYLCADADELEAKAGWHAANAVPAGLNIRMISGAEGAVRLPGARKPWAGALFSPDDGRAEPFRAVPAMAGAARRRGARIFTGCAVRGLETAAGRVAGVVTERGALRCDSVVLAGGAWSRRFCHNLGLELPQLTVVNSVLRTRPLAAGLEHSCSGGRFALRRRADGGYTIAHRHCSIVDLVPDSFRLFRAFLPALAMDWRGLQLRLGRRFLDEARLARRWRLDEVSPFEVVRILDPAPVDAVLEEAVESLMDWYPAFRAMEVAERWAGCIDATPDVLPVISPVDSLPGLFLCTGFSGHGFGIGPGAGEMMAGLVLGETPAIDPKPFRYSRFFDGTPICPMTGV